MVKMADTIRPFQVSIARMIHVYGGITDRNVL